MKFTGVIMSCSYGDPSCPCQDGDPCHYKDTADTTAMTPPRPVAERRCNGCGHQWAGPAPVVLCGECWRKTWPFIWEGINPDARAQAFIEAAREFVALANTIYTRDRDGRAARRLANRRMGELARLIMEPQS